MLDAFPVYIPFNLVKIYDDGYVPSMECREFDYDIDPHQLYRYYYPKRLRLYDETTINLFEFPDEFIFRLIELLPSFSSRFMSYTCKKMYIESINLRGLEVEYLDYEEYAIQKKGEYISMRMNYSGRMCGSINAFPSRFLPYLKVIGVIGAGRAVNRSFHTDESHLDFSDFDLLPLNTAKRLFIRYSECEDFYNMLQFIKPHLKVIQISVKFSSGRGSIDHHAQLHNYISTILSHITPNVEEFVFKIEHSYHWHEKKAKELIKIVKKWLKTRHHFKKFIFVFGEYHFILHENDLLLLQADLFNDLKHIKNYLFVTNNYDMMNSDGFGGYRFKLQFFEKFDQMLTKSYHDTKFRDCDFR